jgi:hypothetical protein
MLDALRRTGRLSCPAHLSVATPSAGAQGIDTTSVYFNLGLSESLTNQIVTPIGTTLKNCSLNSQIQMRLALSQNSLLPIHNGNDIDGRIPIKPASQSL